MIEKISSDYGYKGRITTKKNNKKYTIIKVAAYKFSLEKYIPMEALYRINEKYDNYQKGICLKSIKKSTAKFFETDLYITVESAVVVEWINIIKNSILGCRGYQNNEVLYEILKLAEPGVPIWKSQEYKKLFNCEWEVCY